MKGSILFVGALASAAVLLSGCGATGTASATVRFSNITGTFRSFAEATPAVALDGIVRELSRTAPTAFEMMLIAAYLTEDIDPTTQNNKGVTSMIYLNNDCGSDIMHCDISAGTAEDGAPMSKIVTTFFNFGATTSAVNTALNAQARAITAASYKYARLEFCKYNSGNANNIKWADGSTIPTGTPQAFKRNSCTVNSALISPALTIAAGGTATITLSYDLTPTVTASSTCTGDDSAGSVGTKRCFTMPTFTPSAS